MEGETGNERIERMEENRRGIDGEKGGEEGRKKMQRVIKKEEGKKVQELK